jgi:hypothetical protein
MVIMRSETEWERDFRDAMGSFASGRSSAILRGAFSILAAASMALLAVLGLVYPLLRGWTPLPLAAFVFFWMGIACAIWYTTIRQLAALRGREWLAAEVDRKQGLHGLVGAALEFAAAAERLDAYSGYLRRETVRLAERRLRELDPDVLFPGLGRPAWTVAGLVAGIVVLVQLAFAGGHEGEILSSLIDPGRSFSRPRGYNLLVTSRDRTVLAGSDVACEAVNFGTPSGQVCLRVSSVPGVWKRIMLVPDTTSSDGVPVTIYRHRFTNVRESFDYRFDARGRITVARTVTVLSRPVINRVGAIVVPPPYTDAPPETTRTLAGRVYAVVGSRVKLIGETSKPIMDGRILFSRAAAVPIAPAQGGFAGSFGVAGDDTFSVEIVDTTGLCNECMIRYPVVALIDMAPTIELLAPEDEADLPLSMEIALRYRASDDYGLSAVSLNVLREKKNDGYRSIDIPLPPGRSHRDVEASMTWSLSEMRLFPGDELLYYLEAVDNNTVTGPSRSRTETRRLVVPSLADMYERISEEEAMRRESLAGIREESRRVRERLGELADELKATRRLDWSWRREAGELVEQHEEMMEKIREAGERLDATLETLEENRVTSQEIGEKLASIRDLLERIESEELKAAIENFRKRLGEVDAGELAAAMREIDVNMDELAKRLDRTVALLKQVMLEEKMEEFVRRMESLIDEQAQIRDSDEGAEERSRRQRELAERTGEFEKDLSRFGREDTLGAASRAMEGLLGDMGEGSIENLMSDAADELSEGDIEGARSAQEKAMDGLLALYFVLARAQFSIRFETDAEAMRNITRAARGLVEISKEEEGWLADMIEGGGAVTDERVERQVVLREAMRSIMGMLYETARRTMVVSGVVFMHLDRAMSESDLVLRSMELRRPADARRHAEETYERLNLAVIELLRVSASMGSCSGQGAQAKMQTLTENQCSIDQQLREMLGGALGGQWTMEQRANMARLAAEQRRLEDLLEEIVEEARTARQQLGRLDDLGEEMIDLAERLDRGELDDGLIEREERILSRMLESQRSLARRDYKRERTSRAAGEVAATAPDRLAEEAQEAGLILESIRRGMMEKGPAEYEQLIRLYFRALSKKVRSNER